MADLRVNFCGVELKNPVTTASGTFGFGHEYANFYDLGELGGVGAKGLTPEEQLGNPAPAHCGDADGHSQLCRPAKSGR